MNDHIQYQTMMLGAFGGPGGLGSCGNKNFRKALKKGEVSVMKCGDFDNYGVLRLCLGSVSVTEMLLHYSLVAVTCKALTVCCLCSDVLAQTS